MDEGFNTFIDLANAAKYFPDTPYGDTIEVHPLHLYGEHARPGDEQPLISNPTEVRDLFWVGYQKPALMMQMLRYEVLGKDRFDAAFRAYIRAWAFKHPTPADFFRSMEDPLGEDLSWFWRGWFYRTDVVDLAVDSVRTRTDSSGKTSAIFISSPGGLPMPVDLRLSFADGKTEDVRLPVEIWYLGKQYVYQRQTASDLVKVEIDPAENFPDLRRENNTWLRSQ
jgi:aminopeptidase N